MGGVRRLLRPQASGQGANGPVRELEDGREAEGVFLEDMERDRAWRQEWAVRAFSGGRARV